MYWIPAASTDFLAKEVDVGVQGMMHSWARAVRLGVVVGPSWIGLAGMTFIERYRHTFIVTDDVNMYVIPAKGSSHDFGDLDDYETTCGRCKGLVIVVHGEQQPHPCSDSVTVESKT
jgi:hypothetical protein